MHADARGCACGERYSRCTVWSAVRERLRDVDGDRMLALDRELLLTRRLARAGGDSADAREYRAVLARLYDALCDVTGARVVVDTSKAPSYALALGRIPSVRLSVVHLVRDPRATAFSRLRDPDPDDTGLVGSALLWDVWNVQAERLFRGPGYVRVRHEDFAVRPAGTISRVLGAIDHPVADSPVTEDGRAVLAENHSVAGNRARFRIGEVRIAPDDAWRRSLPRPKRAIVGALTWPVGRRYGYGGAPLSRRTASEAGSPAAS